MNEDFTPTSTSNTLPSSNDSDQPLIAPFTKMAMDSKPVQTSPMTLQQSDEQVHSQASRSLDPLYAAPRLSSRIWCICLGIASILLALLVWWLAVCTPLGQSYEEIVMQGFDSTLPAWLSALLAPLHHSFVVIALAAIIIVVAAVIVIVRKRWWLLGQLTLILLLALAAEPLKKVLPRPTLVPIESLGLNSAPSGHTLLVMAACAVLVCAVSRPWRAWAALFSSIFTLAVGYALVADRWHRPVDVMMSMLLVGGICLLVLAGTRTSGMDLPLSRRSSLSVQILGSMMITLGLVICCYSLYLIWQILPGIDVIARWAYGVSYIAAYWMLGGVSLLVFGLIMVLRQASAAPLSHIGLVGAPPTPPPAAQPDRSSPSVL